MGKKIAFLMLALAAAGCVNRSIVINSDPPGAAVWINEHRVGVTPVTYDFITHGRYIFRLEKNGFQEHVAREMVRAPVYQWIPLDFVFEWLLPLPLEDKHSFRYALTPLPPEEKLQLETPESWERWVTALQSQDPEARRSACIALARLRDPATAEAVLKAADDPNPAVREEALAALRGIKGAESLGRLAGALRRDPDPEVRWRSAAELEALGSRQAVPQLIEALGDPSALVRAGAAEALKGIADPRALGPLIAALKDSDTSVRRAVVEGLGKIGDKSAVRPLTRKLFHRDVQTRRLAAFALARLNDPRSAPFFVRTFSDKDREVRRTATEAVIAFGNREVVPSLISRLGAWKPWVREHAALALGGLKDPRAEKPLKRAYARETDRSARAAMAKVLASLEAH